MNPIRFLLALALLAMTAMASAQVQKCTAANGKVTYTDTFCPSAAKDRTLGIAAMAPREHAAAPVAAERSLAAENADFNKRHAQRARDDVDSAYAANQRAMINDFYNKPLAPGEKRTLTVKPAAPQPETPPRPPKRSDENR